VAEDFDNSGNDLASLQMQIEEANKEYRGLLDAIGDSIFLVDFESSEIIDFNTHAARRLGYEHEELAGLHIDFIETALPEDYVESTAWTSHSSGTEVYECMHRRKDGTTTPVEVSSRLVRYSGKAVLLKVARDITLRKELELKQRQIIADLEAYAHSVAHDLKNPIAILMGFSDLVLTNPDEPLTEQTQELVATIHKTSLKMRDITNALLQLAEFHKRDAVDTEVIDLGAIASETLNRLANIIDESQAQINLPDVWPQAVGYAPWVEEVITNYISNAIKYGGEPPIIEVAAGRRDDGMILVAVRDNGAGISAEDQVQLFEEFARFDASKAEGHGLGLSIVKRIVNKLDGSVGVKSQPGEGSTFWFTLPGE